MRVAISGASGFVGQHLSHDVLSRGGEVVALTRADFDQGAGWLASKIKGCDALINLCGESINQRWSEAAKKRFFDSRVVNTQLLVESMSQLDSPPKVFISTSAIGAFDSKGVYTELSPPNAKDFLGKLSQHWELAATGAEELGVRTLIFRFALVLGSDGGLLKQLLFPFRLGLGGPIGDGRQPFSWIHIDDLVATYRVALNNEEMSGLFHLASPYPQTNRVFTKTIGKVLKRPTLLPVPIWVLKLIFGEGADVMASGQHVISERLDQYGFQFAYPDLEAALVHLLHSQNNK